MYHNSYGAALSNNPFIDDPTNTRSRFPDISTTTSSPPVQTTSQFTSWIQPGMSTTQHTGYSIQQHQQPQQQQQLFPQYQQPQQQQQAQYQYQAANFPGPSPVASATSTGSGFQPSSAFGQQMAAHISGSSYGYLSSQPQQQQQQYHPVQQQLQANQHYIAQFDPYGAISQGWDGSHSQQQQQQPIQTQSSSNSSIGSFGSATHPSNQTTSRSSNGALHPREFVRTYKREVESWDPYTWKQLLGSFEQLKEAWDVRKREVAGRLAQMQQQMQYMGAGTNYYQMQQIQQEGPRLQTLAREAETNFDSVTASTFQMQEVFQGYRQSGDAASKRRVREATNVALKSLPDWPQPMF
ncbi:hypothetical protein AMATHDRAFT_45883 [Amanita thiersii Skay4041]|uniref:Uncharacterized protein n=1 Tax=Amanita thiersii Skay4041 TaxID=703135 RepID=A0A2A9NYG3_9AGAR|nr:hypothetical protein AMATHDRAFT_45883 [Amanita thiersii Skay4041]